MKEEEFKERYKHTFRKEILKPDLTRPNWLEKDSRNLSLLRLDKNENTDFEYINFLSDLMNKVDKHALPFYPDTYQLYNKIAKLDNISAENLLLTAGSDGAIRFVFESLIYPGDKVIHTDPTFAMYYIYSKMFGAKEILIKYRRSDNGPILDFESIIKEIKNNRPKLFALPCPDSPTGNVILPHKLEELIKLCEELKTIVLIDEAYYPFYDNTVIQLIKSYSNLVVVRTFAKTWGLAGLRIGYLVASAPVCKLLHKLRPMYEVNTIAVRYMELMLDYQQQMRDSIKRLLKGKKYFIEEMNSLGFKTLETHGNFVHVNFGTKNEIIHSALDHIVLYKKEFSHECLKEFSRFSITTKNNFQNIVENIRGAIRGKYS